MTFDPRRDALRQMLAARNPPAADHTALPNTPEAIKRFQRFHGLVPDGIVGPKTSSVLRRTHTRLVNPNRLIPHQTTGGPAGHPIYNV